MKFLLDFCCTALHEIPRAKLMHFDVQPEPRLAHLRDDTGCQSWALMAEAAPYRRPTDLDWSRIETIFSARVASAKDHIWSLRDDPGYFSETLKQYQPHGYVCMKKNASGEWQYQISKDKITIDECWSNSSGIVVRDALREVTFFSEIIRQTQRLKELDNALCTKNKSPKPELLQEYSYALQKLRRYVLAALSERCQQTYRLFNTSPPIRQFWDDFYAKNANWSVPPVQVDFIFHMMFLDLEARKESLSASLIIDEAAFLMNTCGNTQVLLSPIVLAYLSDCAILAGSLKEIDLLMRTKQSAGFISGRLDVEREKKLETEFRADFGFLAETRDALAAAWYELREKGLLNPEDGKYDSPIHRRRTKEVVGKRRAAEAHLDLFWTIVDKSLTKVSKPPNAYDVFDLADEYPALQRTSEWIEKVRPSDDVNSQQPQTSAPFFVDSSATPSLRKEVIDDLSKLSIKTKTRGNASTEISLDRGGFQEDCPAPAVRPIVEVNKRQLKVFGALFFDPETHTTPGELAWADFLHVMTTMGFSAQNLYGSVWHFEPTQVQGRADRSIQFHEPHPSNKVPFCRARRWGRRLTRAYGWEMGMFVLKGSVPAAQRESD